MQPVISQDGTIENSGAVQPGDMTLPEFAFADPGVSLPSVMSGAGTLAGVAADPILTFGTVVSSAGTVGGGATTYAPVSIVPVFASHITSLGAGSPSDPTTTAEVEAAINAAISTLDATFASSVPAVITNGTISNTVTVSIQFDYGFVDTSAVAGGAAQSSYGLSAIGDGSYGSLTAQLSSLLPNLPNTDPTGGGLILETNAQAQVLGIAGAGSGPAGYVGLNTIANGVTLDYNLANQSITGEIGAIGIIEHEITEIFGRVALLGSINNNGTPIYSILDLYRFSAAATPALTAGAADYFSLNSGTTALGYFNNPAALNNSNFAQGGDTGDWASSGTHAVLADAFDAFITTGTAGTISALDESVLTSIGLQLACFMEGTRIQTAAGERRIETLSIGDELVTLFGGLGRAIWLGRRAVDLTRHPKPWLAWPVRVRAGAFAPGMPARDLYLSPNHAIYADGMLIPVKLLINDTSIQQMKMDHVVYHHVELPEHDVIMAEGMPAETYLDVGDRETYAGQTVMTLHPDFTARRWEMAACAPLVQTGKAFETLRRRVADRAAMFATRQPELTVAMS